MKKTIIAAAAAMVLAAISTDNATAQESYSYSTTTLSGQNRAALRYTRSVTRYLDIDWQPEQKEYQRYTVSVSPLRLISNGIKFDFEVELPKPGHWLGTSIQAYLAPPRDPQSYYFWDPDGNNRASMNSGWGYYHRMWGLGTSATYKNTFSHRGWYYSTGVTLDFFRVGVIENTYVPYIEDNLEFYNFGHVLDVKSYFKSTVRINIGKHMAISERCYFDIYAGVGYCHSFYNRNDRRHMEYNGHTISPNGEYNNIYRSYFADFAGFAYRGLFPSGGFRFGVLLWKKKSDE
jgi:hypothetical protein